MRPIRKRKRGNGINPFEEALKGIGVPKAEGVKINPPKKYKRNVIGFLRGETNLLVFGEKSLLTCAKLMRLRCVGDFPTMKWIPQNLLTFESEKEQVKEDVIAIVNLFQESNESKVFLLGNLLNRALLVNTQILIAARDDEELSQAFPYDIDTIEAEFEIWKLGE